MNKNEIIPIYIQDGILTFRCSESCYMATREEYEKADRCVGSIFEALEPCDVIELSDGVFELDDDLNLGHC